METKDKPLNQPFRQPPTGGADGEKENQGDDLLKVKINGFLISYFGYLVWGLAIIIFAVGLLLFVYPNYRQLGQANRAAKENLLAENDKKADYLNSVTNLKKSFQLVKAEEVRKIVTMLPSGSDASGIISEIERIALRNGAILRSVKVNAEADRGAVRQRAELAEKTEPPAGIFEKLPAGVGRLKIEVSFGSINYPVLKNIIKTFENNLRLFDISKIDYGATDNKATLIIYSYYLQ